MLKCLNEIAKIETGKSFREKIMHYPEGECMVIQMKDVSSETLNIIGQPNTIHVKEINRNQLLEKGDILFVAKGNNNYSIEFALDCFAVAVSFFFVIKVDRNKVLPAYLAWYLNSSVAQSYFTENREGSTVGNIRKEVLEKIEIEIPSLERQYQIAQLGKLMLEEKSLTRELVQKKEQFITQTMLNLIK